MNEITITSAQYLSDPINGGNSSIVVVIDSDTLYVPLEVGNRHYDEIMRQVEAGTLTIQDAD
jgi:hypothetical protein